MFALTTALALLCAACSHKAPASDAEPVHEAVITTETVSASDTVDVAASARPRPLTQYALVDGPGFRDTKQLASLLRTLGFKVKIGEPRNEGDGDDDVMAYRLLLSATRPGAEKGSVTTLKLEIEEDILMTIDFADGREREAFVESRMKSGHSRNGNKYSHPLNADMSGRIYARVDGNRVRLIYPFEMPPYEFI